jgi:hypothetical protein
VVLSRGPVVSFGGVTLVAEIAQVLPLPVKDDGRTPQPLVLREPDAFVAGPGIPLARVPGVLSDGGGAEVGPAIVQAIAVDVVDDAPVRRPDKLAVHEDSRVLPVGPADGAFGVDHVLALSLAQPPFVSAEVLVVARIDDREPPLSQRYSPKGIPVPNPPIREHHPNEQGSKAPGNCNRDLNLADPA